MELHRFCIAGVFVLCAAGCDKSEKPSAANTTAANTTTSATNAATNAAPAAEAPKPAAAEVACEAVVAKLMSIQTKPAGASEKKLFEKMCAGMDAERRACIVAQSSLADIKAKCGSGKAF